MSYIDDPQVQTMIDNMPDKTGKSLEESFSEACVPIRCGSLRLTM